MRERRKGIVAHVLAPRLLCVAHKLALLIIVDGLTADGRQHDTEDDEYRQPDLPHKGGVVGNLIQQPRQEAPTHGGSGEELAEGEEGRSSGGALRRSRERRRKNI